MSESCNHNCESCASECKDREAESLLAPMNENSNIKNVIAVVSGKGGVGKSIVTSMLAVAMQRKGKTAAILDADITGPSIPRAFGLNDRAGADEDGIKPEKTSTGIEVMSINLLLEGDTDPVIWRGPVIAGAVKQFWTDVVWGKVDYMFVDLPPGTGDVPLTVFQSLPITGIVVVTSPQELVSMIVAKAVKMAEMMNVPIIGIVENMSYFKCPDCDKLHHIFGESRLEQTAEKFGIKSIARLPIDPKFAELCDCGEIEHYTGEWLTTITEAL